MVERKKQKIFNQRENLFANIMAAGYKEGIPIEKGVTVNEHFLNEHRVLIEKYMDFFIAYPDLFIDLISTEDCPFHLFFYQRIILRALMRHKEIYITAGRATSKTFLAILALMLQCIFIPGRKVFIVATYKKQAAKIAKQKCEEIFNAWPILKREFVGWQINEYPGNYGNDYVTLTTHGGSTFDVVGGDGTRGLRRHGGILEELRRIFRYKLLQFFCKNLLIYRKI